MYIRLLQIGAEQKSGTIAGLKFLKLFLTALQRQSN